MSLYADDDLEAGVLQDTGTGPLGTIVPSDPLQALAQALSLPPESAQQAEALAATGMRFEERPEKLPDLCAQLLPMVADGGESLLQSWTLDMVALAVGRSGLRGEVKIAIAQASLAALDKILRSTSPRTLVAVIPIFSTIYPILFRILAAPAAPPFILPIFVSSKARILALAADPAAQPRSVGVKAAAWKFVQKVLMAGTRATHSDPRLQKSGHEVSVANIGGGSSLDVRQLEDEAQAVRTQLVTALYASAEPTVIHAVLNTFPALCKARPMLAPLLVSSMASWTPAALEVAGCSTLHIRAVEKTLRSVMSHLARHPSMANYSLQLSEAIGRQKQRVEALTVRQVEPSNIGRPDRHGRPESSADAAKRRGEGPLADGNLDISSLAPDAVVNALVRALRDVSDESLKRAFEATRSALASNTPGAPQLLAPLLGVVKDGGDIVNPLEMDLDDDVLLLEPIDTVDDDMPVMAEYRLPAASSLDSSVMQATLDGAVRRIWNGGDSAASLQDIWNVLLSRVASRATRNRASLLQNLVTDAQGERLRFASVWLNEEWLAKRKAAPNCYDETLDAVVRSYATGPDVRDTTLAAFLSSVPEITPQVIDHIEPICSDTDRMLSGFLALRDMVEHRPPVRAVALSRLLELCTHSDRKVRVMAITTVRRWVPSTAMAPTVVKYALAVLERLVDPGASDVSSRFLPPVSAESVQQHVELAFALSRRDQSILDDIFRTYPRMSSEIQDRLESLLTPLIQSLGASRKLLDILKSLPAGADKLAVRVMAIMSAGGSSPVLVSLVKALMAERELDPRFIIPVIGELDKAEIEKQIPSIVNLLVEPDGRDVVRTAFASALQKMTPADLLVCLHSEDGKTALRQVVEAIGICFSMTTVFRSDVLATAMQRIVDLPTPLPVCFVRTVIQAVTTYKSLVPFIANKILPKLVARRIWETPQLWDGFVRLVRVMGQASFGAMMQMPVAQIKEVVDKQPALRAPLRAFLSAKPAAQGQMQQIFGEPDENVNNTPPVPALVT